MQKTAASIEKAAGIPRRYNKFIILFQAWQIMFLLPNWHKTNQEKRTKVFENGLKVV